MSSTPKSYVIVFNVSKRHNIGTILRCCTAFGVDSVCLVGSREYNTFGSHGSDVYVQLRHYNTLQDCCDTLKQDGCTILGIEITDEAMPVHQHPFTGPTAFMLGNEGQVSGLLIHQLQLKHRVLSGRSSHCLMLQGLSSKQKEMCDGFVYIPQYGNGTASLNVAVACSIVLHHFALWAGFTEHERQGEKYVVAQRPVRSNARGMDHWHSAPSHLNQQVDGSNPGLCSGVVPPTEEERQAIQLRRQWQGSPDESAALEAAQQFSDLFDQ